MFSNPIARTMAVAALVTAAAACGGRQGEAAPAQQAPAQPAAPPAAEAMTAEQVALNNALPANAPTIQVYKSPTCGCCSNWVTHMLRSGVRVEAHDQADVTPIKDQAGVPVQARSCHTGLIGGYAIEGHVPADVIKRLLAEHPSDVAGLAVPGMVSGSPGMDGPDPQHYDVIAFTKDGHTRVYASR
jgi:hypothetical protein